MLLTCGPKGGSSNATLPAEKTDVIAFAEKVSKLNAIACGDIVHSLMLARALSKAVRGLDKLSRDVDHRDLA
jgi:hypothetical protein